VEQLRAGGEGTLLGSALAVCDVSGSMSGSPMEMAVALSLLVAELAAPPFKDIVCTFSHVPKLHQVVGATLADRVRELKGLDWEMNTNLNAVFQVTAGSGSAVRGAARSNGQNPVHLHGHGV